MQLIPPEVTSRSIIRPGVHATICGRVDSYMKVKARSLPKPDFFSNNI